MELWEWAIWICCVVVVIGEFIYLYSGGRR